MRISNLFWGAILILLGLLFLFRNLGWVEVDWKMLFNFWPVLIIFWGITFLPGKARSVISILAALVIAFLVYISIDSGKLSGVRPGFEWNLNDKESSSGSRMISEPYANEIRTALLALKASKGSFDLKESTGELIEIEYEDNWQTFNLNRKNNNDTVSLDLVMRKKEPGLWENHKNNDTRIKLHDKPIWEMNLAFDAGKADLDLSRFKTRKVNIKGNAAKIELTMGSRIAIQNVMITGGVQDFEIRVPENSGCQILNNSKLSSKNFHEFEKTGENIYRTPNFEAKDSRIFIRLDASLSKLDVDLY